MTPIKTLLPVAVLALLGAFAAAQSNTSSEPGASGQAYGVKDGIDPATGLVAKGDYMMVRAHCTVCHSSKLVLQNRATRDGWERMIRWMQETQKLWDLGENEDRVLDYLATYYAPVEQGRRPPLEIAESDWYEIEENS